MLGRVNCRGLNWVYIGTSNDACVSELKRSELGVRRDFE